jgi:hypothetical protein
MMYLAFRKRPTTPWNKLICWWTKGPYYHVAIGFKNPNDPKYDTIYEATPTGGTRVVMASYLNDGDATSYHDASWDIVPIPATKAEEEIAQAFLSSELGRKYDWFGLSMANVIGCAWENANKWFCSEWAVATLQKMNRLIGVRGCSTDPNELFRLTTKAN